MHLNDPINVCLIVVLIYLQIIIPSITRDRQVPTYHFMEPAFDVFNVLEIRRVD